MKGKSNEFHEIVKSRMEDFLNQRGFAEFSVADNRSRGLAFLRFYLYDIFSVFNEIDEDNIESAIVDKENDLGIDFIFPDENQIFIIQSKYIGKKSKIDLSSIDMFLNVPKNLKKPEFTKKANSELQEILLTIKDIKNPTFNLIFITSDSIPHDKIDHYNNLSIQSNISFQILDLFHLKQEYKRVESLNSLPPNEITLELGNEDYFELEELGRTSKYKYPTSIFTLKGTKVQQLYQRYNEQLFNYNIRLWLGAKNPVNRGMIDTIKSEPDRFIYYNNGITAVCDSFEYNITTKKLICTNFQIINGAQTVTTISKQDGADLATVKVLFRIIAGETGKKVNSSTGLNETIVKNTNSQSIINPSDFRSNDLIQISIEYQARNLEYKVVSPFKPIHYQRKRRREKPRGSKVISMQDLGKSYYAYAYNPFELNASNKKLWDTSSNGVYYQVFGYKDESADTVNIDKLHKMFAAFFIYEYIKMFIKEKGYEKTECPAMLFKYHILWGVRIIFEQKYHLVEDIHSILKSIVLEGKYVNSKVNSDFENKFQLIIERVIRTINACIRRAQKGSQVFVIRNLQRNKDFIKEIEMEIKDMVIPSTDIPDLL